MANTHSAKKAIRVQERRRQRNQRVLSAVKTAQKTALSQLASNSEEAKKAVVAAISQLDRALSKGVIHRNKAARRKSRLSKKLNLILGGKKS